MLRLFAYGCFLFVSVSLCLRLFHLVAFVCILCASVCMCLLLFASVGISLLEKTSLAMAAAYGRRRPAFFLVERNSLALAIAYERRWPVLFLVERNSLAMAMWPVFFGWEELSCNGGYLWATMASVFWLRGILLKSRNIAIQQVFVCLLIKIWILYDASTHHSNKWAFCIYRIATTQGDDGFFFCWEELSCTGGCLWATMASVFLVETKFLEIKKHRTSSGFSMCSNQNRNSV